MVAHKRGRSLKDILSRAKLWTGYYVNRSCVGLLLLSPKQSMPGRPPVRSLTLDRVMWQSQSSVKFKSKLEVWIQNLNVIWRIFQKAEIQYLTFKGRLKCRGEGLIVVKILYCSNEGLNVEADIWILKRILVVEEKTSILNLFLAS